MHEPLQHSRHLFFGRMAVSRDRHLDFHRRILVYRHILAQSRSDCHSLRVNNLDHRLRVLVHKLGLYRQTRRMVFVYDFLKEEKLLLQTRILTFYLMYVKRAKLQYFNLLADGVQDGVTHKKCTGINTKNDMFCPILVCHRYYSCLSSSFGFRVRYDSAPKDNPRIPQG